MKAVSIRQPWASLVAVGAKRIETRSWPTKYRGPLLIHASVGFPRIDRVLCDREPFRSALFPSAGKSPLHAMFASSDGLPRGQVVAVAELVECLPTEELLPALHRAALEEAPAKLAVVGEVDWCVEAAADPVPHTIYSFGPREHAFGDYRTGRYGWVLDNVRRLPNPVPAKGALSLWTPKPAVLELVLAQVDA